MTGLRSLRWVALGLVGVVTVLAQAGDDELRLRDGTVLRGKAVEFDGATVVFRSEAGLQSIKRADVASVWFGGVRQVGGLPAGLSAGEGFRITRWATFHPVTQFRAGEAGSAIGGVRISADGRKIAFWAYNEGCFTINPDGSGLTRIGDYRCDDLDLSADGRKVAWLDHTGLYVSGPDGAGKLKLPGGFPVNSIRLTADGRQVIALSPERGLLALATDGSDVRRVTTTEAVAKVAGTDANGNHWRGGGSGIAISDDGARIVFHFLWNCFAINADGTGLRQLSRLEREHNLSRVRISGDGRKVCWQEERGHLSRLTIEDWSGGGRVEYTGEHLSSCGWLAMTRDGSQTGLGWGMRLFSADGRGYYNVITADPDPPGLNRPQMLSITADGRRGCLMVEERGAAQIALVELDPPALAGAPGATNIRTVPRFVLNDGSTYALLTCEARDPELSWVKHMLHRNCLVRMVAADGRYLGGHIQGGQYTILNDRQEHGDEKAGDGVYSCAAVRLAADAKAPPGPISLRLAAANKSGHGLIVDLEGLEVRNP